MAAESAHLHVRMSKKLKDDFADMCKESEIDMSDKVREIVSNLVRNYKRQNGKLTKDDSSNV